MLVRDSPNVMNQLLPARADNILGTCLTCSTARVWFV